VLRNYKLTLWIPAGFENRDIDPPGLSLLEIRACDMEVDDWASLFEVNIFGEPRGMLIADVIAHVATTGYSTSKDSTVPANRNYDFGDLLACP